MRPAARLGALGIISAALVAGIWLAARGKAPDRRDLDALVTVTGDLAHDATHPLLDLTRMSTADEVQLGAAIDGEIRRSMKVGGDPNVEAYLAAVASDLAPNVHRKGIPYVVALVDSQDVNAFSVAGGRIYVTTGMLSFVHTESELASVIGHEMSHVDLKHCVEKLQLARTAGKVAPGLDALARLGYEILSRGFSEEQEMAADVAGARLAAEAGYDPWAETDLFERLKQAYGTGIRKPTRNPVEEAVVILPDALDSYFATHPPPDRRIEAVRRSLEAEPSLWRDQRRYVGAANLAKRRAKRDEPLPSEYVVRTREPAPGPRAAR